MSVDYAPKFLDMQENVNFNKKVFHGEKFILTCETDENPKGEISWFFTTKDSTEKRNINFDGKKLELQSMNEQKQGEYECVVENSSGRVKRSFNILDFPNGEFFI